MSNDLYIEFDLDSEAPNLPTLSQDPPEEQIRKVYIQYEDLIRKTNNYEAEDAFDPVAFQLKAFRLDHRIDPENVYIGVLKVLLNKIDFRFTSPEEWTRSLDQMWQSHKETLIYCRDICDDMNLCDTISEIFEYCYYQPKRVHLSRIFFPVLSSIYRNNLLTRQSLKLFSQAMSMSDDVQEKSIGEQVQSMCEY